MDPGPGVVGQLFTEFMRQQGAGCAPDPETFARQLADSDLQREFRELVSCFGGVVRRPPAGVAAHVVLAGRYELLSQLGAGGFGKVWLARDQQLDRMVAVKLFDLLAAEPEDVTLYFQHELKALARLQHPGVVAIHAAGDHGGRPFLVMDLVRGRSLADVVADLARSERAADLPLLRKAIGLPCPPGVTDLIGGDYFTTVARITVGILRTLEAAHGAGVLHRDIKPANVMLTGGAQPVVLDFGIASLTDLATGPISERLVGTVNYFAPEQIRTHKIGRSVFTDVYQVGLVLYELLTLRPAFAPQDGYSTIPDRILRGDFVPPCKLVAAIPARLQAICLRAVQHHPEQRFASATAFRQALEQWLQHGTLPAGVEEAAPTSDVSDPGDPQRYAVIETLVRNEFETVQRGYDRFLRCEVDLKRAGPDMLSPQLRQRLRKEAEQLMRVNHPGIARLLNVVQDGGDLVLVLEPIRGAPLAERLHAGQLPVDEVQRLGRSLCDALHELHRAGIVHCCLGPETVWITPEGQPRLASFTFARDMEGSPISAIGLCRTRPHAPSRYLAPEQAEGRRPDARADIFALGCLLFRCLTGRDPEFDGPGAPDPRLLRKELPRALASTVQQCMSAAPAQRLPTAAKLAQALG